MKSVLAALDLLRPWIAYPLGDPPTNPQARLDELRSTCPGKLPEDYTAVLLALRQAVGLSDNRIMAVEPSCARIPGQFTAVSDNPEFGKLYGLGGGPNVSYNLASSWQSFAGILLPKNLLPIGSSYSDKICIDVSEAGNGRIFYWWHEGDPGEDDAEGYPGWGNTFLLAHSFTDLCARIAPPLPNDPDNGPSGARITWTRP